MVYILMNFIFLVILSFIIFIILRPQSMFPNVVLQHNLIYFYSPIILTFLNFILSLTIDKRYLYFALSYLIISLMINIYSRIKIKKEIYSERKLISLINEEIQQHTRGNFRLNNIITLKKRHGINNNHTVIIKFNQSFNELNLSIDELINLQRIISSDFKIFVEIQFTDIILKENGYVYNKNKF